MGAYVGNKMELKIDSKVSYDVDVHIMTEIENIDCVLKSEGSCKVNIQGKHAILYFDESKSNIFITFIEKMVVTLLNYLYYCVSYDDFFETCALTKSLTCIKTCIDILQDNSTVVNVQYTTDESLYKGGIDIGKVVSNRSIIVDYKLDEIEYIESEKRWVKESYLYMLPAMLIILIGICASIFKQYYFLAIVMCIFFIGLAGLIYKFAHEVNEKLGANMEYLKYRLKKISSKNKTI